MIHFTLSFFYIERHFFLFVCFFLFQKKINTSKNIYIQYVVLFDWNK